MRKKIADLKNPPKRPSEAEMRKELDRLQKENTALLQLKELEIENLKLKGMPASDIAKKESEMEALKAKQAELNRIVNLKANLREKPAPMPPPKPRRRRPSRRLRKPAPRPTPPRRRLPLPPLLTLRPPLPRR